MIADAAAHYAAAGLALVPIGEKKRPVGKAWQQTKPCAPDQARELWGGRWSGLGLGCVHAHSGTFALDIDDIEDARRCLARVDIDLDELLAAGAQSMSPRADRAKAWFRSPPGLEPAVRSVFVDGRKVIEFRGAGQDVLPPSQHPDGGEYSWVAGELPDDFPPMPEPLFELLINWDEMRPLMAPDAAPDRPPARATHRDHKPANAASWNEVYSEIKARYSVRDALGQLGKTPDAKGMVCCPFHEERTPSMSITHGQWGERWTCFHGGVYASFGYGKDHDGGFSTGDSIDLFAYRRGISVREAAVELARELGIQLPAREETPPARGGSSPPPDEPPGDRPAPASPRSQRGTDIWFGRMIVDEHGADIRYIGSWKLWMTYDRATGRWSIDEDGEVMRRAKWTADRHLRACEEELRLARQADDKDAIKRAQADVKAARRYSNAGALRSALSMAQCEERVARLRFEGLDHDPLLFGVGGAQVIDLRTGQARAAARHDFITRGSSIEWSADAQAPRFLAFLEQVLPSPAVRDYLQRFLGYCLTAQSTQHLLHIFHGSGANGKSTLLEALRHVFGTYASAAPPSLLMARRGEQHPTELVQLHGRRLCIASELPEGGRLNETQVKQLTGGDKISARRMREDFWEFEPTHKLLVCTNHKPRIKGTDHGIWRRIRCVPFAVEIPEADRDPDLPQRLREEAPGILRWLVEGHARYRLEGVDAPPEIVAATKAYREEEDHVEAFAAECLVEDAEGSITTSAMHSAWCKWANAEGLDDRAIMGKRTLTRKLKEKGYLYNNKPYRGFFGVAVRGIEGGDEN